MADIVKHNPIVAMKAFPPHIRAANTCCMCVHADRSHARLDSTGTTFVVICEKYDMPIQIILTCDDFELNQEVLNASIEELDACKDNMIIK